MRIAVEYEHCVGAGMCVLTAPTVFGQDDDGLVRLLTEHPSADDAELVRDAVALCPAAVLAVVDDAPSSTTDDREGA